MLFSLLCMVLRVIFRLAPSGDERDREVEILVLRHQVKVLKRKAGRPQAEAPRPTLPRCSSEHPAQVPLVLLHPHPSHAAPLARCARQRHVDLPASQTLPSAARPGDLPAHRAHGQGEPPLGLREDPGRASEARRPRWGHNDQRGCCCAKASGPRHEEAVLAGRSSCVPRPRASWRVTASRWRPRSVETL
jgi:hypothetical protein